MAGDPNRYDDLFAAFGPYTLRRMFGGEGIYRGQLMFGLVYEDRIFFKVSEDTRVVFEAEGCGPLRYKMRNAEGVLASYYELPDRLYDDPEELADWARAALAAAASKKAKAPVKAKGESGRGARKPVPKRQSKKKQIEKKRR